jgi:hypothetical protein
MAVKNITDHLDPVDFAELKRLMDLLNDASEQTTVKNLGHQHSIQLEDEKIVIETP